jgi:type I restriction enzyme S subunit
MRNIGQGRIRQIRIPLPPPDEMEEAVRRAETLLHYANTIEKQVAAASARADRLTPSILAKAFRGELVPTEADLARQEGRDYEPASVLLERICSIRENKKGQSRDRSAGGRSARTTESSAYGHARRPSRRKRHPHPQRPV